jgi:FkbM family methyltransferase
LRLFGIIIKTYYNNLIKLHIIPKDKLQMNKIVNSFVYQRILENNMPNSTIPAWIGETYSQCYEDIIIESSIRVHVKKLGRPINGITYIEIGANHPVCTSASYLLHRKYGVKGILVEANPKLIPALQKYRPNDLVVNAAVSDEDISTVDFYVAPENEISSLDPKFVRAWKDGQVQEKITVPVVRINHLLEMASAAELIMLSIDVEGYDMRLLEDIDFTKYHPFIIQVEPSDSYAPGTGAKMINFLDNKGYTLIGETDVNLIFKKNT